MRIKRSTIATLMCLPVIMCLALCIINLTSVKGDKITIPFATTHKYTEEHMLKYTGFGVDLYVYDSGIKEDGTHLSFKSDYGINVSNLILSCAVGEVIMSLAIIGTNLLLNIKEDKKADEQSNKENETTD